MKRIIVLVLLLMALIPLASAECLLPYPIWGKYDYFGLKEGKIKIEAFAFGEVYTGEADVNEKGEYSTDFSNLGLVSCAYPGVTGRLVVCDDNPLCTYSFTLQKGQTSLRHDFVFVESGTAGVTGTVTTIVTEKPTIYQCYDGSLVGDISKCPQPTYTCADGTKVTDASLCPIDTTVQTILKVGGTTLGAIGLAALYRYYRRKKQHKRAEKMAKTYISKRSK